MALAELLQQIDSLKKELDGLRPLKPEQEQRLFQKFRLEWNYHSNALEGNSITLGETEMFLLHGVTARGKPFKDYLDIKGHDKCITYLLDLARGNEPLTEVVIRELHKILLVEPYEVDAVTPDGQPTKKLIKLGEYKTLANHVRTSTGAIHYYATPEETPAKMGDLMGWLNKTVEEKKEPLLIVASLFHHRFTEIHPFDDGNGRMARLLMNLILMREGYPPVVIQQQKRQEYLQALQEADQGVTEFLVEFIGRAAFRSLDLEVRAAKGEEVSELEDLDKRITLLKQSVAQVPDQVELSDSIKEQLFESFVIPVVESIAERFQSLNDLFKISLLSFEIRRVNPDAIRASVKLGKNVALGKSVDARTPLLETERLKADYATIGDQLRDLLVSRKPFYILGIKYGWSGYRKDLARVMAIGATVEFSFHQLGFHVSCEMADMNKRFDYRAIPSRAMQAEIVSIVVANCLSRLEQSILPPSETQ